ARRGAGGRHVGGVVPAQHRASGVKIVDLEQASLELVEIGVGRSAAPLRRLGRLSRLAGAAPFGAGHAETIDVTFCEVVSEPDSDDRAGRGDSVISLPRADAPGRVRHWRVSAVVAFD